MLNNNSNNDKRPNKKINNIIRLILLFLSFRLILLFRRSTGRTETPTACNTLGSEFDSYNATNLKILPRSLRAVSPSVKTPRLNVVHIIFDDMRNSMRPYVDAGHPMYDASITPRLNNFLLGATAFNARTAVTVCSPSRWAAQTSKSPFVTKSLTFETLPPETCPGIITIPEYFKSKGYVVQTVGKYFHANQELKDANKQTYSQLEYDTNQTSLPHIATQTGNSACLNSGHGCSMYCAASNPSETAVVSGAINFIKNIAAECDNLKTGEQETNWGLFLGFHSPHWQNAAPKAYLKGLIDYIDQPFVPDIPKAASWFLSLAYKADFDSAHMKVRFGSSWQAIVSIARKSPDMLFSDNKYRKTVIEMLKYYFASIRYGLDNGLNVIDTLDRYGFANNTIIVIHADHGLDFGGWGFHMGKNANPNGVISVYPRCQPIGTLQTDDCMTHSDASTTDRRPITNLGITLETLNLRLTDWWYWHDEMSGTGPLSWENMPANVQKLSLSWPNWAKIDAQKTGVSWSQAPVGQTELYAMENFKRTSANRAKNPTADDQAKINQLTAAVVKMGKGYKNICVY